MTQTSNPESQAIIYPQGVDGYVLRLSEVLTDAANKRALALADHISGLDLGLLEVAPSLASVYVRFDAKRSTRSDVFEALKAAIEAPLDRDPVTRRTWTIPACFEGGMAPQLAEAATLAGLSEIDAVNMICEAELRVLAIGFAPGQPYIGLLPEAWDIPRQSALTDAVPAGALTVAVRQIVLFANRSATGWRQVGLTGFRPFDKDGTPQIALKAGDGIRFTPVPAVEFDSLENAPMGGAKVSE